MTENIFNVVKGAESPLKLYYDEFDVQRIDWTDAQYKTYALTVPIQFTTDLLVKDWSWRAEHKQNVVAQISGSQGSGKSLFFCYGGLLLGKIFGVPFTPQHVFFSPEELKSALDVSKQRETFLRDEHKHTRVGLMAHMVEDSLADYEDQVRKHQNNLLFASPQLQEHSHFFEFETMHITFDETGYPTQLISMLKTPRYTDKQSFVWRGMVAFPMPSKNFLRGYDARKDDHLNKLKLQYGNTLDPIKTYAEKIFRDRGEDFVRETRDGFIIPIKDEAMDFIICEEIGTGRFTVRGYTLLKSKIRELILVKYEEQNFKREQELEVERQKKEEEKEERRIKLQEEAELRRETKLKIFEEKIAEDRRKNDLKARALELKEKELAKREAKREKNKEK